MARQKPAHHKGSHKRRAKQCTDWAWAHPDTTCRRCGLTYTQAAQRWGTTGARWTGGHVIDGMVGSPYQPEHDHCNKSAGATMGNARRKAEPHTEAW